MPLSNTGKKLKREFKKRYGKDKGESVFFATENSNEKFADAVTKSNGELPDNVFWLIDRILKAPVLYDDEGEILLTKAAYPIIRKEFANLPISIENPVGSTRHWKMPDGTEGSTTMTHAYGYIRMTEGLDGDHLDCFLGDNENAPEVYVVTTNHAPEFTEKDEQKTFIGFNSEKEAVDTFHKNYNNPKFFRSVVTVPISEFKEKLAHIAKQKRKFIEFKSVI